MITLPIQLIQSRESEMRRIDTHECMSWLNVYDYAIKTLNKKSWLHKDCTYDPNDLNWTNGEITINNKPISSKQRMNWKALSEIRGFPFSDNFILRFRSHLHLSKVLTKQKIQSSTIFNLVKSIKDPNSTFRFLNPDQIIDTICIHQNLSEDLLCRNYQWWNWKLVSKYQNITEGTIMTVGTLINYDNLRNNYKTSFDVKLRFIPGYTPEDELILKYKDKSIDEILAQTNEPNWSVIVAVNKYSEEELKPYIDDLPHQARKLLFERYNIDVIDKFELLFDYEYCHEVQNIINLESD